MLSTIQIKIFLSSSLLSKNKETKICIGIFYCFFYIGVKFGLSHEVKNIERHVGFFPQGAWLLCCPSRSPGAREAWRQPVA